MKKRYFYYLVIGFIFMYFNSSITFGCKYGGEINECLSNQENPRTITDFVCIQGKPGNVMYQVILDKKFKEVDEKIELYLERLEKGKNYYFGPDKQKDFTDATNDIEFFLGDGGEFAKAYKKICDSGILEEAISCSKLKRIPNFNGKDYLQENIDTNKCNLMYKVSLENYRDTAYEILKNNKANVMTDNHKLFTQEQRGKFDDLINIIMVNLGYLERLGAKWQSKTKHPN